MAQRFLLKTLWFVCLSSCLLGDWPSVRSRLVAGVWQTDRDTCLLPYHVDVTLPLTALFVCSRCESLLASLLSGGLPKSKLRFCSWVRIDLFFSQPKILEFRTNQSIPTVTLSHAVNSTCLLRVRSVCITLARFLSLQLEGY